MTPMDTFVIGIICGAVLVFVLFIIFMSIKAPPANKIEEE